MTWVMVDVEADGPVPGLYSMISVGAVAIDTSMKFAGDTDAALTNTFYGELAPISDLWVPEALAISGYTRKETMQFGRPEYIMEEFKRWIKQIDRPMFISDNNGFDWQFVNYYFHKYTEGNPFGFSSTNLGSLYKGMVKDTKMNFKHLRKTKHTHNPVDDAKGNAEALLNMIHVKGLK